MNLLRITRQGNERVERPKAGIRLPELDEVINGSYIEREIGSNERVAT